MKYSHIKLMGHLYCPHLVNFWRTLEQIRLDRQTGQWKICNYHWAVSNFHVVEIDGKREAQGVTNLFPVRYFIDRRGIMTPPPELLDERKSPRQTD